MRKALLLMSIVFALASFTNVDNQKIVLKDIDGTLLQSYAVIDKVENTVTFTVDANTTVSSSLIDGEFKIFLVENGSSNENKTYTLTIEGDGSLSFDHYFEANLDVASEASSLTTFIKRGERPKVIA